MSLPEISRRCLACGASVRAGARFCPQCGNRVVAEGEDARDGDANERPASGVAPARAEDEGPLDLRPTRETIAPTRETVAPTRETFAPAPSAAEVTPGPPEKGARAAASDAPASFGAGAPRDAFAHDGGSPGVAASASSVGGAGGRPRRAAARVKETVMPRVERMRDEALVVLEETPDDSGLRFVVIAVALFVLFLLFLLLSTTVLR